MVVARHESLMKHPRQTAVALRYRANQDGAPRVVAQGRGLLAERILEIAEEHGVPVVEDRLLVEALAQLELGAEIPEALYQVVAEVLVFIYSLDRRRGEATEVTGR